MARLVLESGIRLIMVLGHTHCTAIDVAVERWLEKRASAWPWAPKQGVPFAMAVLSHKLELSAHRWVFAGCHKNEKCLQHCV